MRVGFLCARCRPSRLSPSSLAREGRSSPARLPRPRPKTTNLVEEIERFETREHVALQAEAERHHRDDHCHPDDNAHRRENSAQLCLSQVSKSEMEDVEKAHRKIIVPICIEA